MTIPIKIVLGMHKQTNTPFVWDSEYMANGHWLLVGPSGTGKTHQLRRIIHKITQFPGIRIHSFDTEGDLGVAQELVSEAVFTENSSCGVNPLSINPDPEYGGVRRKIVFLTSLINRYSSRKLGENQEAVLSHLLYDIYRIKGFNPRNPDTWAGNGKKSPNLDEFRRLVSGKLKAMMTGEAGEALSALEDLSARAKALEKAIKEKKASAQTANLTDPELEKLKKECKQFYCSFIDNIKSGRELDDLIKYGSKNVVQSIYNRITNLHNMGIFKSTPPNFDKRRPVWKYRLSTRTREEQGYIVELYLEKIYARCRQGGLAQGYHTFAVIDEASKFVSDEHDHIINIIAREGRKFGLGLILASQSLRHFTDDIITSCATKYVLGVDNTEHDKMSRKLGVAVDRIRAIELKKTALVQIKASNIGSHDAFYDVAF